LRVPSSDVQGPLPEWAICRRCYFDSTVTPGLCECSVHMEYRTVRRAVAIRVPHYRIAHLNHGLDDGWRLTGVRYNDRSAIATLRFEHDDERSKFARLDMGKVVLIDRPPVEIDKQLLYSVCIYASHFRRG
jgi:hypothetical protein